MCHGIILLKIEEIRKFQGGCNFEEAQIARIFFEGILTEEVRKSNYLDKTPLSEE